MRANTIWRRVKSRVESGICRRSCRKQVRFRPEHPIVSFTFDDFPASAYQVGGQILEQCGLRGTYYTALGLAGITNELGEHFALDDLHELHAKGHDLACHTFSHHTCSELSPADFEQDIAKNAERFSQEFPGLALDLFSYPKGVVKPRHHRRVTRRFQCLRTVANGVNRGVFNLNYVLAVQLYDTKIDVSAVDQLITRLESSPGWLVFYTHDVRDNPSRFGTTPGLFAAAVARAARSSAKVLPVSAALACLAESTSKDCPARPLLK